MPIERRRHLLYEEVKEVLSVDSADELMDSLPPVGWADGATKSDVSMVRTEIDVLRAEMRTEMSSMRIEVGAEIGAVRGEMSLIRSEMYAIRHDLHSDFVGGMADLKVDLQRWTISTLIAMTGLFGALVFAAVKLGQ